MTLTVWLLVRTVPVQMRQQGLVSSVAYSLYLNYIVVDVGDVGTLLFGSNNYAKNMGDLGTVPALCPASTIGADT